MDDEPKYKKCPHCKGKTGFSITVYLGGTHDFKVKFNGKVIDEDRHGTDDVEHYASCLDCGKNIPRANLNFDK